MIRIGFDAKRLFNNKTGLGNYARTLVSIIAQNNPQYELYLYTPKLSKHNLAGDIINLPNVVVRTGRGMKWMWRSKGIIKDLKQDQIDLFIGLSNELPLGINKTKIPSIVIIHDLIFKVYPNTYPKLDRWVYNMKFKYACQKASQIVAISECTKRDIERFYKIKPDNIEVLYQTCSSTFLDSNISSQEYKNYPIPENFNLYVGSITERKNLISIIEAYNNLKDKSIYPLVIVGRGKKYKEECKALISKYSLQDRFIWLDDVNDDLHLKWLYEKANGLIYPSLYEGFGIPVLESLAVGTPVITSEQSSMSEISVKGTILIDPINHERLSDAITQITENKELKERLGQEGQKEVLEKFSAININDNLNRIIKNTLDK